MKLMLLHKQLHAYGATLLENSKEVLIWRSK